VTTYDPTDLDGQEREQAEVRAEKRSLRKTEDDDFKWLMSSKRGRAIIWRLLDQAGVFRISFTPNALQMAFNEGNRNYGNKTLSMIHALCPELYPTMVKEATNGRSDRDGDQSN
jgi:hypothetical protein